MEYASILANSTPLVLQTIKRFVNQTIPGGSLELSVLARNELPGVSSGLRYFSGLSLAITE
jgi:hypothetical protein